MQPLYEVSLTRPWHWGIAIIGARGAAIPDSLSDSFVAASPGALVLKVRHAQDIEAEVFEGDWDWAVATIDVRYAADFASTQDPIVFDGSLHLPDGVLAIGDADSEVTVNDLGSLVRVRVVMLNGDASTLDRARIELAPQS